MSERLKYDWLIAIGLPHPKRERDRPELPRCPLSSTERHVARVLSEHMFAGGTGCCPSVDLLASEAGLSPSTVWAAINVMEQLGFLGVKRPPKASASRGRAKGRGGRGQVNTYSPAIPETIRRSDAFQEETIRRAPRNYPADSPKLSGSRTRGFKGNRGMGSDASAPDSPSLPCEECNVSPGRGHADWCSKLERAV